MSDDLRLWLQRVGLEQLTDTLAASDIDLDLLPDLSDEDLKELGLSLGHRRRLLRAIAELASAPAEPTKEKPAGSHDNGADASARDAERRQITVLFCDLVGSTELARRHDPEDLRELLRHYHGAIAAVVQRFGGYVANYLGDGILAYFGWPRAGEEDAAQAVRAGLATVAAAGELGLRVHVGIASGTVVVGDLDGASGRQAGAIAGETPNLAARLEELAGPGQVVIAELTRELIGAAFILDDLGPQQLKGIAEAVRSWQVLAERSVESRFEARTARLTRFIGREHEIALLLDRFERAATGEGQAVLLSGEAGIGKSRIVQQLQERLSGEAYTRLRFQCSPSHTDIALHPIIRHLEHAAGFHAVDSPELRFEKLEALLRQGADDVAEGAALLAPLLSLPGERRASALELTIEQRTERTFQVLIDQLIGLAGKEPVLYILEDAHWLDPTTREMVTRTLGVIGDIRVMMLITHRPDFQTDWPRHPQVTALTLSRLSRQQGAEIVRVAAGDALPQEMIGHILRRAEGVPLFIEELTRSVVETDGAFGEAGIPETLQASLLARLDRLGADAREVAQVAAVIGREFSAALLTAVAGKSGDSVERELQRLVAAEIVLPQSRSGEGVYAFRHALLQDAAYQSLLLSRRRQYHGAIAEAVTERFADLAENEPDLVARHYTAAAMPERAVPYWLRAGEHSRTRFAIAEAITHLERGVPLARDMPEGEERSGHLLALLLALGEARQLIQGHLHEAMETFREAAELARSDGSPEDFARAALGLDYADSTLGFNRYDAVPVLEAALDRLGGERAVTRARLLGRLGRRLAFFGNHARGLPLLREGIALARECNDRRTLWDVLQSLQVAVSGRAIPAPEIAERRRVLDEMIAAAGTVGEPGEALLSEMWRASGFLELGDHAAFEASLKRFGDLSERYQISNFDWGLACGRALRAILYGQFDEAERLANRAFELGRDVHGEMASGVYGVQMFTIRREQGRLAEVAGLFRRFVDENPGDLAWRPGLALIACDLGFEAAARKAFDEMAAADGFALPADAKRGLTLSYLAEVCSRLGDSARAEPLYELLLPYQSNMILAPVATVCCGAAARYLGMLAGTIGNWTAVEEHFERALALDESMHAWPWLAHTQHEFAALLLCRNKPADRARARELLTAAREIGERLGMPVLLKNIDALDP